MEPSDSSQPTGVSWNGIHPALREAVIASLAEVRAKMHADGVRGEALAQAMYLGMRSLFAGQDGKAAATANASIELMQAGMSNGQQLASKLMDQAFGVAIESLSYGLEEAWLRVRAETSDGG